MDAYQARAAQKLHSRVDARGDTPERKCWRRMKRRCFSAVDPQYKNYGARGITVCERWLDFRNFIADMGQRPAAGYSIERINNDGNYEPSNCRWATHAEQARNKRTSIHLEFGGERRPLVDWCAALGLDYATVRARYWKGWTPEQVLATRPWTCNVLRLIGGKCRHGHDLIGRNAITKPDGTIRCRTCANADCRRHTAKKAGSK